MVKRKGYPNQGEKVLATVTRITPYSASCKLDEYEGKEGMIHVSEASGKWVKDIRKFIKPNKTYVVKVIGLDKERGHINLSLKRVSKKESDRKMQEYKKEQRAEKMLEIVAERLKLSLDQTYDKIGYELQDTFGEMFIAFDLAFKSPQKLVDRGIDEKYAKIIADVAKENIQLKKVKITAKLTLRSYTGDGVEKIKEFLSSLEKKYKMKVSYITAPEYEVSIVTDNPKNDSKEFENQLNQEIKNIKNGEASFEIKER